MVWYGLVILFVAGFVYVGMPLIYSMISRLRLKWKSQKSNVLVLTFDDGPGTQLTPAIMDLLDEHHVKASFFLLGRNIVGREAIVRQIAERGHEVHSHGYGHVHYWKVSPFRALSDIRRGWKAIDAALGVKRGKYPFRPPMGKLNIVCLLYLWIRRVPIIYWSLDSGDTWRKNRDSRRVATSLEKANGAVSLAHDFDRRDDSFHHMVLESTRLALHMAQEKNIRIVTVSELLDNRT